MPGKEITPDFQGDLLNQLEFAIIIVEGKNGQIRYVNRRVAEDLSLSRGSITGRHYREVFWPDFIPLYEELAEKCRDGREHTASYYWSGKAVWEQLSAHSIRLQDGAGAILLSITNINDLMTEKEKYQQLALFDIALGIPNGSKLEADINDLTEADDVTLIYFEIEFFDNFNELYGWNVGDCLLRDIRDWMLGSEKDNARLYRINNGFALLGKNVTLDMTIRRAREILERFKSPWGFRAAGNSLTKYLTVHMGIVFGQYIQNDMRSMLMRTMYAPRGSEGYTLYDEKTDASIFRELRLRDTLINCIMKDMAGFEVYYQPIVDAKSRRWAGLEALCRWTAPDGTRVPPAEFIPAAEKLGLIHKIDSWVCRRAVEYCISLGLDKGDFFLDVNYSPWQDASDGVVDSLARLLTETGYPPEKLVMEITENAKMEFDEAAHNRFDRIKDLGVVLSLDDFGTGYSSLESLIKLSALNIKIDKTFADNIETDKYRQYLLHMLVDIARHLDMKVILEGVETEGQHRLLRDYGIDYYQGYLFAEPLSADALRDSV